jgi:glycosyltransferase involved in cell wall biosynthesis
LNILHLTPFFAPAYAFGGVTRAVEGMARALAARGHTITVLTTDALSQTERCEGARDAAQDGVRVVRVPNLSTALRGRFNLSTPLGMGRAASDLLADCDVLHVHEFRTAENLLVTPSAERLRVPIVLSPHGTLTLATGRGALKSAWDRLFSPGVARRINAVIGLTAQEADEARAAWASFGLDPARTRFEVVPNGVNADEFTHLPDPQPFRQRYGLGDAPVCLFLGRLHARKGVEALVRAFRLMDDRPDARLLIVGPDDGMLSVMTPLLDSRMVVTGYLGGADRLAALAAADVFCLPATGEGLSMAALEALAAGLPVVLSPGCNLPEAAEYGAGVIVAPEPEPLADALRPLLADAERQAAMGAAARRLVRERFTWASVAARLEAVYETSGKRSF